MAGFYSSPYAPKFKPSPRVAGVPLASLKPLGVATTMFGGIALFACIFYAEGIPRVQRDVLMNIPVIGSYWDPENRKIPASDNPF